MVVMISTRFLTGIGVLIFCASAQDLPRRGAIGLVIADNGGGVVVQQVVAGGAGENAGFRAGDRVRSVDGIAVARTEQFTKAIGGHAGGERVTVEIDRSGAHLTLGAVLKPRPLETSPNAEVLYQAVNVRGLRRRVIVTRPSRQGRLPAVLLMHGLGCYSVDGLDRSTSYGRVIDEFEQKDFVTMRVEKTGEGDSEGDCAALSTTPDVEAEGYLAGIHLLKSYDFVDPAKVFVFAHSMGPVVGSLAFAQEPVRGLIAVETVGTSWFEYDLERLRVQAAVSGKTPEEVDREVREYEPCAHRFYVEKEKPNTLTQTPACKDFLQPFGSVPYTYMQAVADISLGKQWRNADFSVLVIYGLASPVTTAHQNGYLADLINRLHPGRATYREVPEMSHDLHRWATPEEYMRRGGTGAEHPFQEDLLAVMMPWLEKLVSP